MLRVSGFYLGRVFDGSSAYVPLHDGLSALYGLNGSGKSRILAGIRDTLGRDQHTTLTGTGIDKLYVAPHLCRALDEYNAHRQESATRMKVRLADSRLGLLMEAPDPGHIFALVREQLEAAIDEQLTAADALSITYSPSLREQLVERLMQSGVLLRSRIVHHAVEPRSYWSVGLHPSEFPDGLLEMLAEIENIWLEIEDDLDDPDGEPEVVEMEYALRQTFDPLTGDASELPAWAAHAIAGLGKSPQRFTDYLDERLPVAVLADAAFDVDQQLLGTLRAVFPNNGNIPEWDIDPREPRVDDKQELEDFSNRLGGRASAALERYLGQPSPELRVEIAPLHQWHHGDFIEWKAIDPLSAAAVSIGQLSSAQQRWARIAIAEALSDERGSDPLSRRPTSSVLLIDEPELALHPQAIRHVCLALSAGEHQSTLVATHSPIVLGSADRVLEVRRSTAHPMLEVRDGGHLLQPELAKPQSEEHGLLKSDFLAMTRLLVLVEGQHDRIVFVELLREPLADARALIVEVGGSLAMAEALRDAALFRALDCPILMLLDDFSDDDRRWWTELVEASRAGSRSPEEVVQEVRGRASHRNDRWDVFRQIADQALRAGAVGRVHLDGVPVLDIPQVFPPAAFGLDEELTWRDVEASVVAEHGKRTSKNFKTWMEDQGAPISVRSVILACRAVSTGRVQLGEREEAWLANVAGEIRRLGQTPQAALDSLHL